MGTTIDGQLNMTHADWQDGIDLLQRLLHKERNSDTQWKQFALDDAAKVLMFAQLWADEKFAEEGE